MPKEEFKTVWTGTKYEKQKVVHPSAAELFSDAYGESVEKEESQSEPKEEIKEEVKEEDNEKTENEEEMEKKEQPERNLTTYEQLLHGFEELLSNDKNKEE